MSRILQYVILIYYLQEIYTLNSCEKQTTCRQCIQDPGVCVWCAMNELNGTRCKPQNSYPESWCPTSLQNPKGSVVSTKADSRDFSSDSGNVIQIKPQRYEMKLRPGEIVHFNFSFRGANDYPVDLYFLLDASKNMEKIKNMTAAQSDKIYQTMKEITNDVYLGIGTFVDKNVLPFTDKINSEMTYSFKHRLHLTKEIREFEKIVLNTPFGSNRDPQEGGLDALAQVIVCKDKIGWRNESRKIVVFLTNGPYHAAGDGRSAGIFQPYDGKCYTENNIYTKETEMDYPSVGMINKLAAQHEVIIIFLVHHKYDHVYRDLSSVVSGSKVVNYNDKIISNSDSIANILKNIYEDISKTIKLKVNMRVGHRKNVEIIVTPDCSKSVDSSDCKVKKGEEQNFTGTIKLLEYDGTDNMIIDIALEGISEKLTLDIDVIKNCECEKHAENSKYCYGEPRECGLCKCGNDRYGDRCACVKNKKNPLNDNSTCIADGSTELCSGHGSCFCGTCQCRDRFEGKYCECNMDSCPRDASGNICNDHGKCDCGRCKCNPEWSRPACDCTNSIEDCKGPDNKICNDRGKCECGGCKCDDLAQWDSRDHQDKFCNISPCPNCHNLQCQILEQYALCHWKIGQCECDDQIKLTTVDRLTEEHLNSSLWNLCPDLRVDTGCYTRYVYRYYENEYGLEILMQTDKNCIKNYLMFGGIFLLTLIVIGLATLIAWRLLTDAQDRMEYKKFIQLHKDDCITGPSVNPLYSPPTTTFNNPAFRKRSVDFKL